jgi:hypothetical protein
MFGTFRYAWFLNNVVSALTNFLQLGLDIDGEVAGDNSGYSVSLNSYGNIVAVGAIYNDGNGTNSGHTRVYQWDGTAWTQIGLDIDGEAGGDNSGWTVSLNSAGDIVAIGALYNDGNGTNSGHVRIYQWNGMAWVQMGADINGEAATDQSGWTVSLNSAGDIVAIGALYNDGGGLNSGHTRVYQWDGTAWTQIGLDINGEAVDDYFGWSVSLNAVGDIVAIGAIFNNGNGIDSGHTRIYQWNGTAWTQMGLDINGEAGGDNSGWSVSLNDAGDRVAIGALYNDGNGADSGHTRVYQWNGTAWVQMGLDINGEVAGDQSSYSVSLNAAGDIVAIGAPYNDGNGSNSGHARIYKWNGTAWVQMGLDIDGEAALDLFGNSVSLNTAGDRVAIGAYVNDGNGLDSGHTRIYRSTPLLANGKIGHDLVGIDSVSNSGFSISLNHPGDIIALGEPDSLAGGTGRGTTRVFKLSGNTNWIQLGQTLSGLTDGDSFGESVSLNSSGNRIAIGAPYNDAGGTNRGVTRILQLSGNNVWTLLGEPISGVANNDYSGYSVSLNSLGNRVIIGSPNSPGGGTLRGSASVFQWSGTAWNIMGASINGEANSDYYGTSVSINASGDVIAIGAPYNDGGGVDSGHVRVFTWSGTAWVQRGTDINGVSAGTGLGQYVCLNDYGDVLATAGVSAASNAGYVAVYKWSGTAWTLLGSYIIGTTNDNSGSLYLNSTGDRLIIGAPNNLNGVVRVYNWDGVKSWVLYDTYSGNQTNDEYGNMVNINSLGDIIASSSLGNNKYTNVYKISNPEDILGISSYLSGAVNGDSAAVVSLNESGDVLVVGAPNADYSGRSSAGVVRVYDWNGSNWVKRGSDLYGMWTTMNVGSKLGTSVAINATGDMIIAGAPLWQDYSGGGARIYKWDGTSWTIDYTTPNRAEYTIMGTTVAMNSAGDVVAIGDPNTERLGTSTNGIVEVYKKINSSWTRIGKFDGQYASNGQGFYNGTSLSLNDAGDIVAFGGTYAMGSAAVFKYNGNSWSQLGTIGFKVMDEGLGKSISLNGAGDRVAVSAGASDSNGTNSGAVRIYQWNSTAWVQMGLDIFGNPGESIGYINLNKTGDLLFIGVPNSDIGGTNSGLIRIYKWDGNSWIWKYTKYGIHINGSFGRYVSINYDATKIAVGIPGVGAGVVNTFTISAI